MRQRSITQWMPAVVLLVLCTGVHAGVSGAAGPERVEAVALVGEPALGSPFAYRRIFSGLSLNGRGDVGFIAGIDDPAFSQTATIAFADGGFDAIFTSAPVPPEVGPYPWIDYPALNDLRDALYVAGSQPISWLLRRGGLLKVFLRVGDPVDGLPGVSYEWSPTGYDLNDAGQALVATPLAGPTGTGNGIVILDEAGTTLVARDGDAAPGGGTFTVPSDRADLNQAGDVAFYAEVSSGRGIFARQGGQLVAIAREGDPAPEPGRTLSFPSSPLPSLADSGAVVFAAQLEPFDVEPNAGIFRYEDGALTTLALEGDPVPDAPGHVFSYVGQPQTNSAGSVVFEGDYYEGQTRIPGVYLLQGGALTRIARRGDVLPQLGGARFDGPDWQGLRINERGDIAFTGNLEDGRRAAFLHPAAASAVPSLGVPGALGLAVTLAWVAALTLRRSRGP